MQLNCDIGSAFHVFACVFVNVNKGLFLHVAPNGSRSVVVLPAKCSGV